MEQQQEIYSQMQERPEYPAHVPSQRCILRLNVSAWREGQKHGSNGISSPVMHTSAYIHLTLLTYILYSHSVRMAVSLIMGLPS